MMDKDTVIERFSYLPEDKVDLATRIGSLFTQAADAEHEVLDGEAFIHTEGGHEVTI